MKKLSLYVFLVLMWCNIGFADLPQNYLCVTTKDTAMDKTSVPNDVKVVIGEKNFTDEDIQDLFKQHSDTILSIKHIADLDNGNIVKEINGFAGVFAGEFIFFGKYVYSGTTGKISNHLAMHIADGILFYLQLEPVETKRVKIERETYTSYMDVPYNPSKRVLILKIIELSEEEHQKLLPFNSDRYSNGKIKTEEKYHVTFEKEVEKLFAVSKREMGDFVVGYACFQELIE